METLCVNIIIRRLGLWLFIALAIPTAIVTLASFFLTESSIIFPIVLLSLSASIVDAAHAATYFFQGYTRHVTANFVFGILKLSILSVASIIPVIAASYLGFPVAYNSEPFLTVYVSIISAYVVHSFADKSSTVAFPQPLPDLIARLRKTPLFNASVRASMISAFGAALAIALCYAQIVAIAGSSNIAAVHDLREHICSSMNLLGIRVDASLSVIHAFSASFLISFVELLYFDATAFLFIYIMLHPISFLTGQQNLMAASHTKNSIVPRAASDMWLLSRAIEAFAGFLGTQPEHIQMRPRHKDGASRVSWASISPSQASAAALALAPYEAQVAALKAHSNSVLRDVSLHPVRPPCLPLFSLPSSSLFSASVPAGLYNPHTQGAIGSDCSNAGFGRGPAVGVGSIATRSCVMLCGLLSIQQLQQQLQQQRDGPAPLFQTLLPSRPAEDEESSAALVLWATCLVLDSMRLQIELDTVYTNELIRRQQERPLPNNHDYSYSGPVPKGRHVSLLFTSQVKAIVLAVIAFIQQVLAFISSVIKGEKAALLAEVDFTKRKDHLKKGGATTRTSASNPTAGAPISIQSIARAAVDLRESSILGALTRKITDHIVITESSSSGLRRFSFASSFLPLLRSSLYHLPATGARRGFPYGSDPVPRLVLQACTEAAGSLPGLLSALGTGTTAGGESTLFCPSVVLVLLGLQAALEARAAAAHAYMKMTYFKGAAASNGSFIQNSRNNASGQNGCSLFELCSRGNLISASLCQLARALDVAFDIHLAPVYGSFIISIATTFPVEYQRILQSRFRVNK